MSENLIDHQFVVGDICMLRSGSPALTVINVKQNGSRTVCWFDNGTSKFDLFPSICLKPFVSK